MRAVRYILLACLFSIYFFAAHAFEINIITNHHVPDSRQRVVSIEPAPGAALDESPEEIVITFTNGVVADRSYIRVSDLYNVEMTSGTVRMEGTTMRVSLPELAPGPYRVRWKARCQCDERTDLSDSFRFTVR